MIFTVNIGSVSKKYALYQRGEQRFFAHLEMENGAYVAVCEHDGKTWKKPMSAKEYANGPDFVMGEMRYRSLVSDSEKDISGIGFRVVAPGDYFLEHRVIDEAYLRKLEDAEKRAPLHIAPMLS